ncbi:protein downstream neighbor of Son [Hydra vulgaris]|uniref:protein downstream neighbor of Son n=1 Tax=Hydra vulgaris TaxID=6087 RepID=UPI001F5F4029|nr:protein downstream neighbor of Son [Hydra vulgaris]
MAENNKGRMLLKVKKKKNQLVKKNNSLDVNKEQEILRDRGKKRLNPFLSCGPSKKPDTSDAEEKYKDSSFLTHLSSKDKATFIQKRTCLNLMPESDIKHKKSDAIDTNANETVQVSLKSNYEFKNFPLDWSIKNQVRFLSFKPFPHSMNLKPVDQCAGIISFTRCEDENNSKLFKQLSSWVYPNIPGLPLYPLKKSISGNLKNTSELNLLSSNTLFQTLVMKGWQNSFQSLYNMLKTGYCPFFYVCSHQYTVLFTATGISTNQLSAVITPTTKGFRSMLKQEGISFEFTVENTTDELLAQKDPDVNLDNSQDFENSGNIEFLDSIGLTPHAHFPKIQEQQRLNDRVKLRLLDNRIESTIRVTDCNSLFNFLLNSTFLCAPSGAMAGVPPTLISPSPFEGGSLSLCKCVYRPLQQQVDQKTQSIFCLDVSGFILPTQLKGLVSFLINQSDQTCAIQLKSSNRLSGLNSYKHIKSNDISNESLKMMGLSPSLHSYLNQQPIYLPNFCDIKYEENCFKF